MKSLPTALTTSQLGAIVNQLESLPGVTVTRNPTIITATATRKATGKIVKVLSAATANGKQWHVMAQPGLITAV